MHSGQETSISDSLATWDIFCVVVDNYGDIGVCWRLSRQLAAEHGFRVRLWVDDLASFQKICPEIDSRLPMQFCRGVEIRHWSKPFPIVEAADVVVEAFACELPEQYVEAMAKRGRRPLWINLEYLSAEDWVDGYHAMSSPHPRLPLAKHFFFPGFTPATGGLLAEKGLAERRRKFQESPQELAEFWRSLRMPAPGQNDLKVSLFCYENAPVAELLATWANSVTPIFCIVPEGVAAAKISEFFGQPAVCSGTVFRKGSLTVPISPFLEQDGYDKLLWACDLNFVRGEDSFVRAQWAARPMVWQIYPQENGAHWQKLQSFLDRYCAALPSAAAVAFSAFSKAWNQGEGVGKAWLEFLKHRTELDAGARSWAESMSEIGDLATNLVNFCKNKLQ